MQLLRLNVGGHDKVKIKCKIGVPDSVGFTSWFDCPSVGHVTM